MSCLLAIDLLLLIQERDDLLKTLQIIGNRDIAVLGTFPLIE